MRGYLFRIEYIYKHTHVQKRTVFASLFYSIWKTFTSFYFYYFNETFCDDVFSCKQFKYDVQFIHAILSKTISCKRIHEMLEMLMNF